MKFFYEYEIVFKYYNGKTGRMTLRADNPVHLKERFRNLYPNRTLTKFYIK